MNTAFFCRVACLLAAWVACGGFASAGGPDAAPTGEDADQRLARRLEWFRDQKFGLFVHWGPYSQLGCIESWPLVWKDRSWSNPGIKTMGEMAAFHKKYWALNRTFNPTAFEPKTWAAEAKWAGMKYLVFTTKHHDGFAMYDTKLSDYRITAPDCPYSKSPHPDVTAELFKAFRAEGFGIGAYYSKADWHSPYYWDPYRPALTRNPNYDTAREPERWAKFVRFVHGQVEELMTGYGRIDVLWLDAGQVRPPEQDLQMDRLVAMARRHQPDLIVVDRTVGGKHENYRTPEQQVPKEPLPYPWETCMTMGTQWSFKPDDHKSPRELIHLLVDVVAKGGNLLLNIGAQPDGRLPAPALERLHEIGDWMAVNAEAIHGTRPITPYKQGRVAFTSKGKTVYAIYLAEKGKDLPEAVAVAGVRPAAGSAVRLLGVDQPLKWRATEGGLVIDVPAAVAQSPPCRHAFVFKLMR